ncbi:cytochrome P450 [Macrolepiota fuliginosa MF-IS2]|uniref:Cytochrome P450 n=1 Tax=Macrolepiota fuliginosa MF-IS2 TaxID=1400762 RepID=A0A9P5XBT1_9AGAR|nr:cytochrome P450 [Macrolepiota fuliginosa MF-IS2]
MDALNGWLERSPRLAGLLDDHLRNLTAPKVLLAFLAVFASSRVLAYFRNLKIMNYVPGLRPLFHPLWFPGAFLPSTWWNMGIRYPWNNRTTLYKRFRSEVISLVPLISGDPSFYTNNLDVARQVIVGGHKTSFVKPEYASRILLLWGMNLLAADGEMWRKHRRILGPAFSNKLYEYVWNESVQTFKEMVSNDGWSNKKSIDVPVLQRTTFKFALFIIGKCGFGFPFVWSEPPTAPDGTMTIQEALRLTTDAFLTMIMVPKWVFKLPIKSLRKLQAARDQLTDFMQSQVEEKRKDLRNGMSVRDDVFTRLVQANENEESKYRLSDEELVSSLCFVQLGKQIGNVFIMLFAGHETTAHTLAATIGFMAYFAEIQEEVHEHIVSVIGRSHDPTWDDFSKLDKVTAVFLESLRLFPSGHVMIREAREDTVLNIPGSDGDEGTRTIPIVKGTQVVVDMIGVQYNPRYFDEPEKFKPSRWHGVPAESEAFTAFSVGPRACLGRKFGMTEAIAFLTMLMREWRVEPLLSVGETKEQWRERVLDAELVITLGVSDMPVRFVKRD